MQRQWHVADRVRQIEADDALRRACAARAMRRRSKAARCGTGRRARAPVPAARRCAAIGLVDVLHRAAAPRPRAAPARSARAPGRCRASWICEATTCRSEEKAPASIRIRAARCVGPIEARQQQVQVDAQGVHRHDFIGLRARRAPPAAAAAARHSRSRDLRPVRGRATAPLPVAQRLLEHRARALLAPNRANGQTDSSSG